MRIVVDWDGTCVEDGKYPKMGEWLPDAVNGLRRLLRGSEVVIFSCSTAPFLQDGKTPTDPSKRIAQIREKLDSEGLYDIEVWTRPYKPPGDAYLDNKAIRFRGDWYQAVRDIHASQV